MFDKPILPSFLNPQKAEGNPVPPARPPVPPRPENVAVAQPVAEAVSQVQPSAVVPPVQPNFAPQGVPPSAPVNPNGQMPPQPAAPVVTPVPQPNSAPQGVPPPTAVYPNGQVPPNVMGAVPPGATNAAVPPVAPAAPHVHEPVPPVHEKPVFSNEADQTAGQDGVVHGSNLHDTRFADIWFTPEDIAYVRDIRTRFALIPLQTPDLPEFRQALEQGFTGNTSYSIRFEGDSYRVERVLTSDGVQFNCRKMPTETPEIESLGFADPIIKHLASLGRSSGLLLFAGPTGQGKTTSASAIMKRFLDTEGGFLYTIEDPPEMPLAGLYHAQNGGLGLCKQTAVENDQWGACLRSALRSKPRYILVGEIRTPETASMCLVAATSGHLVLSTIHANGVEDALNSLVKYASSTGLAESLVSDLLARGILGVVYQRLEGVEKLQLHYETAFANPNTAAADQMRMAIRDGSINLATFMETQATRMARGLPMFKDQ